jgi:F0F1-type ATP synthase membrane subunit b/b'
MREQTENEIERLAQQSKLELRRYSAEESIRLAEEKIKNVMNSDTDSKLVKASIQSIGGLN